MEEATPRNPIDADAPRERRAPLEVSPESDSEADSGEPSGSEEGAGGRARPRRRRGSRSRGRNGARTDEEIAAGEVEEEAALPAPAPPPAPEPRAPSRRAPRPSPIEEYVPEPLQMPREVLVSAGPERASAADERKIALFCDLENIALGVRDSAEVKKFDIGLVLERLLEKGKIIVKKSYCDWERYSEFKRPFHEAAIELIDIPQKYYSGKNSADIKMVVDAMDLCYSKEHLDTFVIMSGDSDFSPLVSKLKENNKYVIGLGVKGSSSNLLIYNCDEFIFYEDVWRDQQKSPQLAGLTKKSSEVFALMTDAIQALVRESKDVLWGSMIKQTMQRKKPSFNEGYYGYSTFSELLEDAERKNLIRLKKDQRSGSYIVTGVARR